MSVEIYDADPLDPKIAGLIQANHDYQMTLFTPDECHTLNPNELAAANVHVLAAYDGERPIGCGALVEMDGYGELKAMYVDPAARGQRIGAQILRALERRAGERGISLLRLETADALEAAVKTYERNGFVKRGPFGKYVECNASTFMEKSLHV